MYTHLLCWSVCTTYMSDGRTVGLKNFQNQWTSKRYPGALRYTEWVLSILCLKSKWISGVREQQRLILHQDNALLLMCAAGVARKQTSPEPTGAQSAMQLTEGKIKIQILSVTFYRTFILSQVGAVEHKKCTCKSLCMYLYDSMASSM